MKKRPYTDDRVTTVPADIANTQSLKLNVRSYAGYANTTFKTKEADLFYWFFESQRFHPELSRNKKAIGETPLLIWLNGGPGAPSTYGMLLENGPYRISDTPDGTLEEYNMSWNQEAHMIFWDQPVGTGYSRLKGEDPQTTFADSEKELSETFYEAMQVFYERHPEYRPCPLYITGESYCGKYIPNLANMIDKKNKANKDTSTRINLKGISVGDPWISPTLQFGTFIKQAYTLGYYGTAERDLANAKLKKFSKSVGRKDWDQAYELYGELISFLPALGGNIDFYDLRSSPPIPEENVLRYMESPAVKSALHVPIDQPWVSADNTGAVAEALKKDLSNNTKTSPLSWCPIPDIWSRGIYQRSAGICCTSGSMTKLSPAIR